MSLFDKVLRSLAAIDLVTPTSALSHSAASEQPFRIPRGQGITEKKIRKALRGIPVHGFHVNPNNEIRFAVPKEYADRAANALSLLSVDWS